MQQSRRSARPRSRRKGYGSEQAATAALGPNARLLLEPPPPDRYGLRMRPGREAAGPTWAPGLAGSFDTSATIPDKVRRGIWAISFFLSIAQTKPRCEDTGEALGAQSHRSGRGRSQDLLQGLLLQNPAASHCLGRVYTRAQPQQSLQGLFNQGTSHIQTGGREQILKCCAAGRTLNNTERGRG